MSKPIMLGHSMRVDAATIERAVKIQAHELAKARGWPVPENVEAFIDKARVEYVVEKSPITRTPDLEHVVAAAAITWEE